jgi:hypothetical protein
MKKYINKIILAVLALLAPMAACDTDQLQDLNVNPQALNEVDLNFVFTAAQLSSASGGFSGDNRYIDWRTNMGYTMYFMQHFATTELGLNSAGDKYFDNDEAWNAPWEFWYGNVGKTLSLIFKETGEGGFEEGQRPNTVAASKILWALNFHRLTDFYGDIPYSEAVQGLDGVFRPKYDTQQSIYMDLFAKLSEGINDISASNPDEGFAASDIMFDGDIAKWKKWGNSLMLRMAMRISNVDPGTAATYVNQAIQGGVMESNADNAWVPMDDGPGEWVNQNGISRAFQPGDGGQNRILGKTLIDFLKGADPNDAADDDPRLMIISEGIQGDVDPLNQEGQPNGLDGADLDEYTGIANTVPNEHFSSANVKLFDDADPYILMNYAEVCFLLAEAAERGIGTTPKSAAAHYADGVRAAMQFYTAFEPGDPTLEVSDAAVDAYLATYPYGGGGVTGSESALEQIGYQMWASKFFNWWEAWSDWRRTGYPTLVPTNYPGSASPGVIPTKLRIPNQEVATNGENYNAGATKPDDPTGKVWWDVDP